MSDRMTPLTPAIVPCCQYPITAAQLSDDRIIATLQSFCDALQLDYLGQVQRIRRQPVLAEQFLVVPLITETGWQLAEVLTTVAIPLWLAGIQLTRLAPEKRELALAFQREAVDTLYRYFYKRDAKQAPQSTAHSSEPPRSPRKMTHKAFERLHQVADELDEIYMVDQEEKEATGDHIVALEAEVKSLKQGPASKVASKPRQPLPQDGPILTAEHRNQAYALARDERRRSGQRVDTLLRELAESFGVEDMSDIPDAAWDDAQTWFWKRRQRR